MLVVEFDDRKLKAEARLKMLAQKSTLFHANFLE